MRLSVMTNMRAIGAVRKPGVEVSVMPTPRAHRGLAAQLQALWASLWCDYVVINCSPRELFTVCAARLVFPFARSRIVSLDTVLPVPSTATLGQRVGLAVKKLLFSRVHLFVEYFKDIDGYVRHYGMPSAKFRYVPFKINRYDKVLTTETSDQGYIFCGGNTRRDFGTLIAAVRELPYPVRIVTMADKVIAGHGSEHLPADLPPNVTVVRHDGSDSFLEHIAHARMVVLPIRRQNISASGIGVYLTSMALGKCVVISSGPAVNGVVPRGAAAIVPPEDAEALRAEVARLYVDDQARAAIAAAGQRYALSLKGEERLCESVLDVLIEDQRQRG